MKKLMFATALVASAAAFADGPLNAISFENYTLGDHVGDVADVPDAQERDNGMYFLYQGESDSSTVKEYGAAEALAAPSITRPAYFAGLLGNTNEQYLELSTEGGVLWRSVNTVEPDGSTNVLGEAKAIDPSTGLYLDTLVQFTPTEDTTPPELGDEDKLAIWLSVNEGVTNLKVRAAVVGDQQRVPATFTVTNKTADAGTWYRLTVKAIDDIAGGEHLPGFQIYLDGALLMSDTVTLDSEYLELIDSDYKDDIANGAVFASLKGFNASPTLQGVGFKGSGALDDIVWTEEDPFAGGSGGDDYKVVISGSDVIITPQAGDLAALQAAIVAGGGTLDVTDVAAVNAALAAEIGSTGIPSWQALFLGVAPTTNGLESVAIKSIGFNGDGDVEIEMADGVTLMTGRGVTINLILKGSDDLSTWTTLQTATDTKAFTAITPAQGETKKFYKVVVEFAATPAQQN